MGQCLRGKMSQAGLIPAAATPVADSETVPTEDVAVVTPEPAEPATDVAAPALDVTPPAPAAEVPENLIAATFGLLRAEPDGSVVIAGSGTPGSEVEVYSNGSLLGKTTVESSGDWVFVPDAPLPVGGVEITLGEAGKTGRAAESFVVAISEDRTSQPLVVASTPGAASEVLQGLEPPAAGTTTEVAAADPTVPAATPPVAPTVAAPVAPATPPATALPTDEPSPAEAPAVIADSAPATPPVAPTQPDAPAPAVPAETEPATAPEPEPATPTVAESATPAPQPEVAVAAVAPPVPAASAPAVVLDGTPPTIDAIELEGAETFFAGGGPEGATMRLYVDDVFIADTKVEGGRWLVEAGKVLGKPSQRVRVDMLQPDSAKVASRAEVNFVVELPVEDAPVAVADAEPPALPQPAPPAPQADAPAPQAPVATPVTAPPAADEGAEPAVLAQSDQPTEPPGASVAATEPGTPTEQPTSAEAAAPADPVAVAEAVAPAAEPAPAQAAVSEPEVPTMVAVAIGAPDAERFVSGKAIIRRGDNLWTIARRTYGEGMKYTTIYQANTGQIRDPDRIYPGQVFELPAN